MHRIVEPMRIQTLTLYTSKLPEMADFYARLGFGIEHGQNAFCFAAGSSKVTFKSGLAPAEYHFTFNVPEHLMQDVLEDLQQKVDLCPIEDGTYFANFYHWNAHALYFLDPDGSIVEYIGRHNLDHRHETQPVPLSVSEIGWVTQDVAGTVSLFKEQFGIDHFRPAAENFAPLGTDEGLLIVSQVGRPWYPVGFPAEVLPLDVEIQTDQGRFLLSVAETTLNIQIRQL
ncbi:MAG: hypothetical protein U0Z75_09565 [Deinococcaceae bacterium]